MKLKKRYILIALLLIAAAILYIGYNEKHRVKLLVYTEDYTDGYSSELSEIFGSYTVSDPENRYYEGWDCSCGEHEDSVDYLVWTITYTDSFGETFTCELDNHISFYSQQVTWLKEKLKAHYAAIIDGYIDANNSVYVYAFNIVKTYSSKYPKEQKQAMDDSSELYLEFIESREIIPLYELDYRQIFSCYPVYVSIQSTLTDETAFDASIPYLESFIETVLNESGGNFAIKLSSSRELDRKEARHYYIKGKNRDDTVDNLNYEYEVYITYQ